MLYLNLIELPRFTKAKLLEVIGTITLKMKRRHIVKYHRHRHVKQILLSLENMGLNRRFDF